MRMDRKSFLAKKVRNKEELDRAFEQIDAQNPQEYTQWHGSEKTHLLISNDTKLVVMWSVMPEGLPFSFFGTNKNAYIYLDDSGVTDRAKKIASEGDVDAMLAELSRLHVAFVDAIYWCMSKAGSKKDRDIMRFTVDEEAIALIKRQQLTNPDLVVVAATKVAEWILSDAGVKFTSLQFFNARKAPWIELFKKYLGN